MERITITLTGFKTKEQAIEWLNQYEGSVEQSFDLEKSTPHLCNMESYIQEMKDFERYDEKTNFNLELK